MTEADEGDKAAIEAAAIEAAEAAKAREQKASTRKRMLLGIYLLIVPVVLAYVVLALWPQEKPPPSIAGIWDCQVNLFGFDFGIHNETRLLLLVLLVGALGSYVHAATSFVSFVGNETLRYSWMWWYVLRPFIGMALALIFYFVLRGGLLATTTDAAGISLYGITAVAGLVGMFSKQATDKLNETFKTMFRTSRGEGDDARKNKLDTLEAVEKVMIPYDKIEKVMLSETDTEEKISLTKLIDKLGPTVTRVPVFDAEARIKYVIHEGLLCGFVAKGARGDKPFDTNNRYLKELLDHDQNQTLVQARAFVTPDTTLADARKAMDKIEHCRDVFVTAHGKQSEPVLGWLTNADIARRLGG
ncbi:MAG: hypothetical protein GY719_10545 [bacterium]|nr:hypothetical protein [bacterium]